MAVYTPLADGDIAQFLQNYDLPPLIGREVLTGGVSNSNWRLDFDGTPGRAALTVVEPRIAPRELDFVLAYQAHLAGKDVALAAPILQRDGRPAGTLASKPTLLSDFLPGDWPRQPSIAQAEQVGELLARMHQAAVDFRPRRSNPMGLPEMRDIVQTLDPMRIEAAVPGLASELATAFDDVLADWPAGLPSSAVHCDLFPDNVLFVGDQLSGAIDFYFACTAPFAYDLATTLAAWCFTPNESEFLPDHSRALLSAYETKRPLSDAERDALPLFARAACLRILATRLRDWIAPQESATVTPKHPAEFARRLRFYSAPESASAFAL